MAKKEYFKADADFLSGRGILYTEFDGEIATRQISCINNRLYASSSLADWNSEVGYLLYDGLKSELDLSDSIEIEKEDFEKKWVEAIQNEGIAINYLVGDASIPIDKNVVIIHIVNNIGVFGKGFVLSLHRKWPEIKSKYLSWYNGNESLPFELGKVQFISVDPKNRIFIANMLAQSGIKRNIKDKKGYIKYDALEKCLIEVREFALVERLAIQMPMIGTGLGGGSWSDIKIIIQRELIYYKLKVNVLTLPN